MHPTLTPWLSGDSPKKIILLRHGAIASTGADRLFIGQSDFSLSAAGRRQAQAWRKRLDGIPLAHILTSDLSRCLETSRIIASDRPAAIEPMTALREIHLGDWEGLSFDQVSRRWPDDFRQRGMDLARFRPPGGESFLDLQRRVMPVFDAAADRPGETLLVVTHAGVIRVILCHVLGMPVDHLFRIDQGLAAMNLLHRRGDGYRVQAINLLPD